MGLRWWKLKRELKRALPKAVETLSEPFHYLTYLPRYDRNKVSLTRLTEGHLPAGPEIGIYLIFPARGVLASHRTMLAAMVRQGISPVVVSNLPLSGEDRETLAATSFRVIERPNIGYDFGGYRDGILSVAPLLPDLRHLWILNDSAWLIDPTGKWFADARAAGRDFTGAVSNYGISKVDLQDHARLDWTFSTANRRFHYVSSSWCIGARILKDPGFLKFWKGLQIRDSKQLTVRRGEVGFSQWVIRRGFSHGATHELDDLQDRLAALSDAELDRVTRHLLVIDSIGEEVKTGVLATDPSSAEGRRDRLTLCLSAAARYGYLIALPYYLLHFHDLPFFKKSVLSATPETVALALHITQDIPTAEGPMIRQEAEARALAKLSPEEE
jgi:hypothetical protein